MKIILEILIPQEAQVTARRRHRLPPARQVQFLLLPQPSPAQDLQLPSLIVEARNDIMHHRKVLPVPKRRKHISVIHFLVIVITII